MNVTPEELRPVVGWEGFYEVSNLGRVRSVTRRVNFGIANRLIVGRVLKQYTKPDGKVCVRISMGNSQRTMMIHLMVLEAFIGPRPEGMEGCHWNDDSSDNRLSNLRWDTHTANMYDRVRNGKDYNSVKTHCPRGHEYTPENTKIVNKGRGRWCRTCHNADGRDRYRAKRAMKQKVEA